MKDDSTNSALPERLFDRLSKIWPDSELFGTFAEPFATVFRVNTLTVPVDQCLQRCIELGLEPKALEYLPGTFELPDEQRSTLTSSELISEGWVYIQNPSSIWAALTLGAQPGDEVLDLTAAPGGKTLVIAQSMNDQGRIAAVEASRSRFFKLKANLERCGVSCAQLYMKDGRKVGKQVPERFDRVLLDAPCSAEAEINLTAPESYANWSEKKVKRLHGKQFQLLESAYLSLKRGGTLVYSTCTFAPEENEAVVNALLGRYDDMSLVRADAVGFRGQAGLEGWEGTEYHPSMSLAVRILPDRFNKGFFLAKLHKE